MARLVTMLASGIGERRHSGAETGVRIAGMMTDRRSAPRPPMSG